MLSELINDDKDGIKTRGGQEFLDEGHGNGIPWMFQNWELLKESIRVMSLRL